MPTLNPTHPPVHTWLDLLDRPDTALRSLAVQALAATHGTDPAVQLRLVRVLRRDGSVYVRGAAARALAPWVASPVVLAALVAALGQPKTHEELRAACCAVLQPHGSQPAVIAALLLLLSHAEPVVRESAVSVLAAAVHDPAGRAALIPLLADPHARVAGTAARALAPVAADAAVQAALVAQLGHPWIAHTVTEALLSLAHDPVLQQDLLPLLAHPSVARRAGAGRVLGAAGDDPAILAHLAPLLLPQPDDHPNGQVSAAIIAGLSHCVTCPAVQAALLPLLADNRWWIVADVLQALTPVAAEPPIRAAIVARLSDPNEHIRQAACAALRPLYLLPSLPTTPADPVRPASQEAP